MVVTGSRRHLVFQKSWEARRATAARADKSIPNGRHNLTTSHDVYLTDEESPSRNTARTSLAEDRENRGFMQRAGRRFLIFRTRTALGSS